MFDTNNSLFKIPGVIKGHISSTNSLTFYNFYINVWGDRCIQLWLNWWCNNLNDWCCSGGCNWIKSFSIFCLRWTNTFFFPMIIPWISCLWRVNQKSCGIQFFLFIAFGLENSKGFHLDIKFRMIPDFFNWQISVCLSIS